MPDAPDTHLSSRRNGRTMACLGCLAISVLSALAVILVFAVTARNIPKPWQYLTYVGECKENMEKLTGALRRYHVKNDHYPEKIEDLYPDFLGASKALVCPAANSPNTGHSSYEYIKPKPDAPGSTIVLRCYKHMPNKDIRVVLEAYLDGAVRDNTSPVIAPGNPIKG